MFSVQDLHDTTLAHMFALQSGIFMIRLHHIHIITAKIGYMPSRGSGYVSGSWSDCPILCNLPTAGYCTAIHLKQYTVQQYTVQQYTVQQRFSLWTKEINHPWGVHTYTSYIHTCGGCRLEARASFSHTAGWTHWNVKHEFEALRSKCTAWYSWGLRSVGLPAVAVV